MKGPLHPRRHGGPVALLLLLLLAGTASWPTLAQDGGNQVASVPETTFARQLLHALEALHQLDEVGARFAREPDPIETQTFTLHLDGGETLTISGTLAHLVTRQGSPVERVFLGQSIEAEPRWYVGLLSPGDTETWALLSYDLGALTTGLSDVASDTDRYVIADLTRVEYAVVGALIAAAVINVYYDVGGDEAIADIGALGAICELLEDPPPTCSVCGNGITEPGEQCDDGNDTCGDGCEADCTFSLCIGRCCTSL